jgi:hypothetical protein
VSARCMRAYGSHSAVPRGLVETPRESTTSRREASDGPAPIAAYPANAGGIELDELAFFGKCCSRFTGLAGAFKCAGSDLS